MPRESKPRPLADILNQRQALGSLLARSRHHTEILRYVQRRLPGFLQERCLACVDRHELLIVYTDSAAFATQLRFVLPGMLGELRQAFAVSWQRIQTRVLNRHDAVVPARTAAVPPATTVRQVSDAASCCSSPEVRAALLRLAATWRHISPR